MLNGLISLAFGAVIGLILLIVLSSILYVIGLFESKGEWLE